MGLLCNQQIGKVLTVTPQYCFRLEKWINFGDDGDDDDDDGDDDHDGDDDGDGDLELKLE